MGGAIWNVADASCGASWLVTVNVPVSGVDEPVARPSHCPVSVRD